MMDTASESVTQAMRDVETEIVHRLESTDQPANELNLLPSAIRYLSLQTVHVVCDGHEIFLSAMCFFKEPCGHTPKCMGGRYRDQQPDRLGRSVDTATSANPHRAGKSVDG
jgi:hypothetical protein